jgi:hypothetical protein
MKILKDQKTFINELVTVFPEINSEVYDEDYLGLISLQIGCFRRFTQKAIDNNDLDTVKKCFDFVDANLETAVFGVENSLMISYLGKLNIIECSAVDRLLSSKMKSAREQLTSYYESLSKDEKVNKFFDDLNKES